MVNDGVTGPHLWAETDGPVYSQVSQRRNAENPVIHRAENQSVTFTSGGRTFGAELQINGFVQPSTVFPATPETDAESDPSIGRTVWLSPSDISIELKKEGGQHQLILADRNTEDVGREWTVTLPNNSEQTATTAEHSLTPTDGRYTVGLRRAGIDIPAITLEIHTVE